MRLAAKLGCMTILQEYDSGNIGTKKPREVKHGTSEFLQENYPRSVNACIGAGACYACASSVAEQAGGETLVVQEGVFTLAGTGSHGAQDNGSF